MEIANAFHLSSPHQSIITATHDFPIVNFLDDIIDIQDVIDRAF